MNELANPQMCVCLRNNTEIWVDSERVKFLQDILENIKESKFINLDDRTINTADIVAILTPQDMEDRTRRRNGMWQCQYGTWHTKGEVCEWCK